MQTPAEARLIDTLASLLGRLSQAGSRPPLLLSVGAGQSTLIEDTLATRGLRFVSDRLDLLDCRVERAYARQAYRCSAEDMKGVPSGEYDLAFSNYLLEHVRDVVGAAREIHRVLKPGGCYVASVPNPTAPEFVLARWTPLWFHRLIRGHVVGEKYYSYRSVGDLKSIFARAGMVPRETWHYSSTEDYLQRFPVARSLARLYDRALARWHAHRLMGNVCLLFEKPAPERRATGASSAE